MADALGRARDRIAKLEDKVQELESKDDELSRRERVAIREELAELRKKEVLLMQSQGMHSFVPQFSALALRIGVDCATSHASGRQLL